MTIVADIEILSACSTEVDENDLLILKFFYFLNPNTKGFYLDLRVGRIHLHTMQSESIPFVQILEGFLLWNGESLQIMAQVSILQ